MKGTEGTENASPRNPFFSFDGAWLGYLADGQLKKVSVGGGAPVTLSPAQNLFGATWGPDDTIVFGQGGAGIWRVSGNGGSSRTSSRSTRATPPMGRSCCRMDEPCCSPSVPA